jgi:hypothetical protein
MSAVAAMVRAKGWLFDLFAHNHAEQLRINRAVQRKGLGIEQVDLPYPGASEVSGNTSTVTINHNYPASPAPDPPVAPPMPPAPPCPAEPGYDAVYEQRQPNGTWKLIRREKLT